MLRRAWLRGILLALGLSGLLIGCRSAPPPAAPAALPLPTRPLCQLQGRPEVAQTSGSGWSFCVRQKADCNLSNATGAISLRWCEQSKGRTCLDTGCQKYRAKECRFAVDAPPGTELTATPPRNDLCGKRWECNVKSPGPRPALYRCKCDCPRCDGPPGESPAVSKAPLVSLAAGTYAVVVVSADSLCPNGRMEVSALEGGAFTLAAVGKCLPRELKMRAAFAPAGGAFFALGKDPEGHGDYHLTGVVEDPDAFNGLLTRSDPKERIEERIRVTGRRMTTKK